MRKYVIFLFSLLITATTGLCQSVEYIPHNFSLDHQYYFVGGDSVQMTISKDLNDKSHLGDTVISIYSQISSLSYLKRNFRIHNGDTLPGNIVGKSFDSNGNLVEEIDSTVEGKILSKTSNYYVNSLKTKSKHFYLLVSHDYIFDTSYHYPQNYETSYFYDDSIRPLLCTKEIKLHWGNSLFRIQEASVADTTINYYSYDYHGNRIKDISLNSRDTLSVDRIYYDSANREIRRISKSLGFNTTLTNVYDGQGNLISFILNMPYSTLKELYYYNSKNELIRKEVYNLD